MLFVVFIIPRVKIMAKEKQYMPQSTAGLLRYFDTDESGIKISPNVVIALSIMFAAFAIIMRMFAV